MPTPFGFVDAAAEADFIAASSERFRQIDKIARASESQQIGRHLSAHYKKYPWTTPGIAMAFGKWKEEFGPRAAKGLSRAVYNAAVVGDDQRDAIEQFALTSEFKRQSKAYRESQMDSPGFLEQLADVVVKPVTAPYRAAKAAFEGDISGVAGAAFDVTPLGTAKEVYEAEKTGLTGVPGIQPVTRGIFTALETPYQEVQGGAVGALTGLIGPIGDQARPAPPGSEASRMGAAAGTPAWEPVSTGGIALQNVIEGKPVDLGTGYFPGGAVHEEHDRRLRAIASLTYGTEPVLDNEGNPVVDPVTGEAKTKPGRHFLTPGRIVAMNVFQPGSKPYMALSGLVDATAVITTDPINKPLIALGAANRARRGFDLARDAELAAAGGWKNAWRTGTHGPTVQQWLDSEKGGRVINWLADTNKFLPIARATNWKIPVETMSKIRATEDPQEVRRILEPILGTTVGDVPNPFSLGAEFRQATQPFRMGNLRPDHALDWTMLDGQDGALNKVYRWMKNAKVDDTDIDEVLTAMAQAKGRPGQYEALKAGAAAAQKAMEVRGVPRGTAREMSQLFHNDLEGNSKYWIDQIADERQIPGLMVEDRWFPTDAPHMFVEFLGDKTWLPDSTEIDKTLAEYGRLLGIKGTGYTEGGIALGQAARKAKYGLHEGDALLTHIQSRIWVPLVLIRGAWTVRVVGEEQLRMAASGLSSVFNHPLDHMLWVTRRKPGLQQEAEESLLDTMEMQAAMSHDAGKYTGDIAEKTIAKGRAIYEPGSKPYTKAWADELIKQNADPIMGEVARAVVKGGKPQEGALAVVSGGRTTEVGIGPLADVKQRFRDGNLNGYRTKMKESHKRFIGEQVSTPEGADAYIDTLYQRLHEQTGGDADLINFVATGNYAEPLAGRGSKLVGARVRAADRDNIGQVLVHEPGAETAHVQFISPEGYEATVELPVDQLTPLKRPGKTLTRAHDGVSVDKSFVKWLDSLPDNIKPGRVVGDLTAKDAQQTKFLDKAVTNLFSYLMAKPTNYLSRSPTFRQFYWRKVEELIPQADRATQSAIVEAAERTGLSRKTIRRFRETAEQGAAGDLDLTVIDDVSKGFGLDRTKDLLYDLNRRSQFFDATRLLFPFGEAWKEVLTRWARIVPEHPEAVRKAQVAINGLRGANPFELVPGVVPDPYKHQGFFFKDETTGEEAFAYPWSQWVSENLIGVPVPMIGSAKGLNLAFNVIPGVGLAAQIPAAAFMDRAMADPKWNGLRDLILPYGAPDVSAGLEVFAPAWMQKALTAAGIGGEQNATLLNNTVMDVFTYGASTGEYDTSTPDGIAKGMRDAEVRAREVFAFRSMLQFGAPSAPSPRFLAEADGKQKGLVLVSVMRDAFYKLSKKDWDSSVTKYIDRFGEKAFFATGPKTLSNSYAIPVTREGIDWEKTHGAQRDKYPTVYGYFAPQGGKFDYTAYLQSLATGAREPIEPKEWARRTNHVLGTMWYDRAREKMGLDSGSPGTDKQRAFLADLRNLIHKEYPGWREIDQPASKIPSAVVELAKASKDRTLRRQNPELTKAIGFYEQARQKAIARVKEAGGNPTFESPGYGEAKKYRPLREYLRGVGEVIGEEYPAFAPLYEQVYSRELKEVE